MSKRWFAVNDTSRQDELGNGPEDWCVSLYEDDTADAIAWMNSDYADCAANARVIAAAPDLLEALELLWSEVAASGNGAANDFGWKAAREATLAALRKATGDE